MPAVANLVVKASGPGILAMRARLPRDLTIGTTIPGPPGTNVTYRGAVETRGAAIPPEWEFLIVVAGQVSATLIAAWILDFLRDAQRVTINRRTIELDDAGQVRRVIEEELRIE